MSIGAYLLLIFTAGFWALTISGLSYRMGFRNKIHRKLGRKLKWDTFEAQGALDILAYNFIKFHMLLITTWWLTGICAMMKGFNADYASVSIVNLRKWNTFSPAEDEILEMVIAEAWAREGEAS